MDGYKDADNRYKYTKSQSMPVYALQSKISNECADKASRRNYDPATSKKKCTHQKNIVKLQLNERFAQDAYIRDDGSMKFYPPENLNRTKLSFGSASTITYDTEVRRPPALGQIPDTPDFDTLWTAIFTLEELVNVEKEIWFIGDKDDFDEKHPGPNVPNK